ncbi:MAG TPA: alpha/beta hydrolase family protein, partial [Nitrososphaerales archaeon]|nr:alpha/beta hydrolase family protein [Nitrososphaerales archaeon]
MATFVLVPGAWLGGWVWKKITPTLEQKGHSVYPITLTGMGERVHLASKDLGVETTIQDVLNVVKYNDLDDFVLVGHSFAGKVVAAVADRAPERVKIILYLDAFRPEKKVRTPQGSFDSREFMEEGHADNWKIPLTEEILNNIGKDVQAADRKWMLSKATPWPMKYATDPVTLSKNFDSLKSAYIFCTGGGDNVEEILKEKLDGPYKVIESGHFPMITRPDELVEDMLILSR